MDNITEPIPHPDLPPEVWDLIGAGDIHGAIRLARQTLGVERLSDYPSRKHPPKCGAMTRKGTPCQAPAYWPKGEPKPRNGRCRMHGGLATGPKTAEGKARIRAANRRRAKERKAQRRAERMARMAADVTECPTTDEAGKSYDQT